MTGQAERQDGSKAERNVVTLSPGSSLGTYDVLGLLGAGGMGEVYRARDTKLGRSVAIKVLPDAFVTDPERTARFEREAKVLASLNHPRIAALYVARGRCCRCNRACRNARRMTIGGTGPRRCVPRCASSTVWSLANVTPANARRNLSAF
jgi:hypothetical protein